MSLNECIKFKKDLKNSKTHVFMHLPEEDKNELYSFHRRGKKKTIWYKGSDWVTMESKNSPTAPEIVSYRCPTFPYNSLHQAVMTTKTPRIKAVEGYQVRFCNNLFINMIKKFYLYHNEVELQCENTLSILDRLLEEEANFIELGNKEQLITYSNELPPTNISINLPMTYSRSPSDAYPLRYCGQKDDLIHKFEFNLAFSSLLLIIDENGNPVKYNKDLLEVESNLEMMPIPELEGDCSFLNEPDSMLVESFNIDGVEEDKELYATSIYYYEDTNPKELGEKADLDFRPEDKHPVQDIFWGARNVNATKRDKNLTITLFDGEEKSPIQYTEKLSSTSGTILKHKSSYKTEFAYHQKGFLGRSRWSNSSNRNEDGKKFVPGIACNGGSLSVKLAEKTCDDEFIAFAVLRYEKRFRFTSYPKTFQERKDLRSTIEPDDED